MNEGRANRVLGTVVAAIVILALVVVLAVKQPVTQLDQSLPEGTVQQYLISIVQRDFEKSVTYLDADTKCKVVDFERAYIQDSLRANRIDSQITGATALVKVAIEFGSSDPFGNSFTDTQTFRLAKADTDWKLTGIPWPTYECGGEFK